MQTRGQDLPKPKTHTARAGLSPFRLARLHDALSRHVDGKTLPGLVALVSRHGEDHAATLGTLAFDSRLPMRRDTIFRLASVTKPITAIAAMILVEECKLRLDDPVDDLLPELANRKVLRSPTGELDDTVRATRSITVRDVLTFRSGYGEASIFAPMSPLHQAMGMAGLPLSAWIFPGDNDAFMKALGALPLAHQPGERWTYHVSADILGVLIARASGRSLSTFMRERIFEPLGMNDTGFVVPHAKLARVAACYKTDFVSGEVSLLEQACEEDLTSQPKFESGAGARGLVSTADDLLALGKMMLNRGVYGRERILSRATIAAMTTDQLTPEQKAASPFFEGTWEQRGWGLGLSVVTKRNDVSASPGRFGWDGAFSASWYVDPREDLVGVLMLQRRPGAMRLPGVALDFWTSIYQALEE